MKKLIRNASVLALGLIVAALPVAAATWNVDVHAGWWNAQWVPYDIYTGTHYSTPNGATVSWYGYVSNSGWTHVSATAPGVSINQYVYSGNNSGYQTLTSAGDVSLLVETGAYSGGTGCGVTIAW